MQKFNRIVHGPTSDVDGLETFWKCLNGLDQKRWYANELYHRKKVDLGFLDDAQKQKLSESTRGKKHITPIYNYNILTNP